MLKQGTGVFSLQSVSPRQFVVPGLCDGVLQGAVGAAGAAAQSGGRGGGRGPGPAGPPGIQLHKYQRTASNVG